MPGTVLAALEFRLGAAAKQVDLSLRLDTPAQARAAAVLEVSKPLRSFLLRWSENPAIRQQVPAIWLELDLDLEKQGIPEPVVCLQLAEKIAPETLMDDLLPALRGEPLGPRQRGIFHKSCSNARIAGRLLYVFSLHARHRRAVRLEILGSSTAESLRDFECLTGTFAPEPLLKAAALLATVERPHLSFDVATEVLPRIGLEGSFRRLPHREPRWAALLDRLVAEGLCTPEKRDALLAWPGYDTAHTVSESWPKEGLQGWCVRSLSHVKLVAEPGRVLEAKAYLTFQHLERGRASAGPPVG